MTGTTGEPLLEITGLRTYFFTAAGVVKAVDDVDLRVDRGHVLGLVGESGSGKSVLSLSVLKLVAEPGRIVSGSVRLDGEELLDKSRREMRDVRGGRIGMVFQQPISSLNPAYTAGFQISEVYEVHSGLARKIGKQRAAEMLARVGIPDAGRRARSFPHELSGGMAQRVMIAMALAAGPELLIADEPTTALDVTIQAQILDLMAELQTEMAMAMVLITHDLGVVAEMSDRVAVMYAGRIVEEGETATMFSDPKHPYTLGLHGSVPVIGDRREQLAVIPGRVPGLVDLPPGCKFASRCEARIEAGLTRCTEEEPALVEIAPGHRVRCFLHHDVAEARPLRGAHDSMSESPLVEVRDLVVTYPLRSGAFGRTVDRVRAVDGVDLDVYEGEALGLVGESGCGKTTLGRTILRLIPADSGSIRFAGKDLLGASRRELRPLRREMQLVFQDPYSSLDPRATVGDSIAEGLRAHGVPAADRRRRVDEVLDLVGLDSSHARRFPHEFSGGQRQRVGIARALVVEPRFLVADEPVSALDVSIRSQILNLLADLRQRLGLTMLFVAHDLSVVEHLCDRVAVMYLGRIVEVGTRDEVFGDPQHPYTRALLSAVPVPDPSRRRRRALAGEAPSRLAPPEGCSFHLNCPIAVTGICDVEEPTLRPLTGHPGHLASCHLRTGDHQDLDPEAAVPT